MIKRALITMASVAAILLCAAQSYGVVMGPARFEVSLPPGEIADADYYVQNDTDQDVHIDVEPENWFKDTYNYASLDIRDWIEFDTYGFDLKPKEIKKLRLRITVPKNAKGELVAQIFITSGVLKEGRTGSADGIKARIGGVLYVAITGTEIVDAEIVNIAVSKELAQGTEKLKVAVSVKNKGNVHIRPTGKVTIESEAGAKLIDLVLAESSLTLPGRELTCNASWDKPELAPGEYKVSVNVDYGKEVGIKKIVAIEKLLEVDKDGKVTIK